LEEKNHSSKEILKSTGIVGGSKLITIFITVAQVKIVAILLGPIGVGLVSLFTSAISLIQSLTGLGIGFSAIRDISQAVKTEDPIKVSKSIITLRRWVWISGISGIILVLIFSRQLSVYTFGDDSKILELCLLSSTILFGALGSGQLAILRGYRKIGTLAKANIYGAVLGFIVTIPLYFFFGVNGIVPVLIFTSLSNLTLSWWFSHKIKIAPIKVSILESLGNGIGMVKLGLFTVLTGFIASGTLYLVKVFIADNSGVDAVGYYAVGATLSITYMGILLGAMGTDYFPKLSAVNEENQKLNKLVNEQSLVTLLLGTPLIIGMYSFLELIITIFYSSKFTGAIPLVQWMLLGVFLRLVSWPKGYVFLAKAKGKIFVFSQSVWNGIYLIIIKIGWPYFSFEIVGIAFAIAYMVGYAINFIFIRRVTSFRYENKVLRILFYMCFLTLFSFSISKFLENQYIKNTANGITFILSLIIAYKELDEIIAVKSLFPKFIKKSKILSLIKQP
jgi:O-antigen/teichoic acid export membrane protein